MGSGPILELTYGPGQLRHLERKQGLDRCRLVGAGQPRPELEQHRKRDPAVDFLGGDNAFTRHHPVKRRGSFRHLLRHPRPILMSLKKTIVPAWQRLGGYYGQPHRSDSERDFAATRGWAAK